MATLDPTCLSRLGECLVRIQRNYLEWMADWSADRTLDGAQVKPMRDEWSPASLATALEAERKGEGLSEDTVHHARRRIAAHPDPGPIDRHSLITRRPGSGAAPAPSHHPNPPWGR